MTYYDAKFCLLFFVGLAFAALASATFPEASSSPSAMPSKSSKALKTRRPTAAPTVGTAPSSTTKATKAPKAAPDTAINLPMGDTGVDSIMEIDACFVTEMAATFGIDNADMTICGDMMVTMDVVMEAVMGFDECNVNFIECDCRRFSISKAKSTLDQINVSEQDADGILFTNSLCLFASNGSNVPDGVTAEMIQALDVSVSTPPPLGTKSSKAQISTAEVSF